MGYLAGVSEQKSHARERQMKKNENEKKHRVRFGMRRPEDQAAKVKSNNMQLPRMIGGNEGKMSQGSTSGVGVFLEAPTANN